LQRCIVCPSDAIAKIDDECSPMIGVDQHEFKALVGGSASGAIGMLGPISGTFIASTASYSPERSRSSHQTP
jgi:hypothetical protein